MISIKINNIKFVVNSKISVLEACFFIGINIPRFCYHENLSVAGNCRMCLVEIEKSVKPVASCAFPVSNNISIFTNSALAKKARENIIEVLLLNHPLDCPICDQGGECDLQDQTRTYGSSYSRFYKKKRGVEDKILGEFIKTIMTRCIHCTRCVRFSEELAGMSTFGTLDRGGNTEIGSYKDLIFSSEISGNIINLCPVGALTSKSYAFKSRPWELKCSESIDVTDGMGANILVHTKENEILRVESKVTQNTLLPFISDKIRFSYDFFKKNRIKDIFFKNNNSNNFQISDWNTFFNIINQNLNSKRIIILINQTIDFESLMLIKTISYKKNVDVFCVDSSSYLNNLYNSTLKNTTNDLLFNKTRICFILSSNLKIEATLLNTKIRLKYFQNNFDIISSGFNYKPNKPIHFINLSVEYVALLFEGKKLVCKKFLNFRNPLLLIGQSVSNRILNLNIFISQLKLICPSLLLFKNNLKINEESLNYFGINKLNKKIINRSDLIFAIDLEDNISFRKLLKQNTKFYWFNTHGSNILYNAQLIVPTLTFFEEEKIYLNNDNDVKKTIPIIQYSNFLKSFKKVLLNLKFFDNKKLIKLKHSFFLSEKLEKKMNDLNKYFLISFINISTCIMKYPLKSILEDFYTDSVITKNSIQMSKRSQEIRKIIN